jgi:hypothetical protein
MPRDKRTFVRALDRALADLRQDPFLSADYRHKISLRHL